MSCEITFAGAKLGRRSDWRRPAGGGGREFFDIDRQAGGARNGECHPGQSGQGESRQVKPGPSMTRGHISKISACNGVSGGGVFPNLRAAFCGCEAWQRLEPVRGFPVYTYSRRCLPFLPGYST